MATHQTQPARPVPAPREERPVVFAGNDGHVYISEGSHRRRLSWGPEDLVPPGFPALLSQLGELGEARIFAHACPSPDGEQVAVFALQPATDIDLATLDDELIDLEELEAVLLAGPEDGDDTAGPGFVVPEPHRLLDVEPSTDEGDEAPTVWPGATVYALHRDGVRVTEVWTFTEGTPTHLEWAPDGRHLLVLHREDDWLHLHLLDTHEPGRASLVVSGAPISWAWQPGGDQLAVRLLEPGTEHPRVLVGRPLLGEPLVAVGDAGRFNAPVWLPGGAGLLFGAAGPREDALIVVDPELTCCRRLLGYPGRAAFACDPTGQAAAIGIAPEGQGPFEVLERIDLQTDELTTVWRGAFLAFTWLPDGDLLLCSAASEGELQWLRIDRIGDTRAVGPAFSPAAETDAALRSFDQLTASHPFLSRDGRRVVYAGRADESVHPGDDGEARVLVTDLESGATAPLGIGRFACFA